MEKPLKFRKKPVVIEAMQFTGLNGETVVAWIGSGGVFGLPPDETGMPVLRIPTLEGVMTASPNDWIIKGVNGEFYPCKPDIFEKTYEQVEG